jgi:hypothetical protein
VQPKRISNPGEALNYYLEPVTQFCRGIAVQQREHRGHAPHVVASIRTPELVDRRCNDALEPEMKFLGNKFLGNKSDAEVLFEEWRVK